MRGWLAGCNIIIRIITKMSTVMIMMATMNDDIQKGRAPIWLLLKKHPLHVTLEDFAINARPCCKQHDVMRTASSVIKPGEAHQTSKFVFDVQHG